MSLLNIYVVLLLKWKDLLSELIYLSGFQSELLIFWGIWILIQSVYFFRVYRLGGFRLIDLFFHFNHWLLFFVKFVLQQFFFDLQLVVLLVQLHHFLLNSLKFLLNSVVFRLYLLNFEFTLGLFILFSLQLLPFLFVLLQLHLELFFLELY